MKYLQVWSYDNYINAHLAMASLKNEGIECWLKDENTVTIDPILANAVGGIKLMVPEPDARRAWELLNKLREDYKKTIPCPNCHSTNMELVSTPRKAANWLSAISTFFLGDYAMTAEKVYHCFNCKKEFPEKEIENSIP
jgi:DNA-directed RNA polymerase subunit RPC12/RpoP